MNANIQIHNLIKIKYPHHFHNKILFPSHISHASESAYILALCLEYFFFLFHKRMLIHSLRFIYHVTSSVKPTMTVVDNILPVEPPCIKGVLPGLDTESVTLASKSVPQLSHLWNGDVKSSYLIGLVQWLYELIHVKHFSLSKYLTTISYFYIALFTPVFMFIYTLL